MSHLILKLIELYVFPFSSSAASASLISSDRLFSSGLPKYVSIARLKVSNAPEMTYWNGTDIEYSGSRNATSACAKMILQQLETKPPCFIRGSF